MDLILSDSDWENSSDCDSSDDLEEAEYYHGQTSCILSSLEETIGKIDEFLSFEREFMLGDVVCSVNDPFGQMGKVVGIDMLVDLETNHGPIIKDVNSKDLRKIRPISVGDVVVHGKWIGRVEKVIDSVSVLFDDGTKCEIIAVDQEKLLPISVDALDDSQYPYYPGQRVRFSNASKPPRWLSGWKDNRCEGTVCSVDAGLVYVDWLASILMGCSSSLTAPPRMQHAKELTVLSCFPHANWHLGDWCIFPVDEKSDYLGEKFITAHDLLTGGYCDAGFQEISVIVKKKAKVDVLWQDGSHSRGLDSHCLTPANAMNAHEFWPQQFVMEKGNCDDSSMSETQRWGVVQAVDAKERTVKVQLRTGDLTEGSDLDGLWVEETMSAYELVEHPDYSFALGDIVFRLASFGSQSDENNITSEISMNEESAQNGKSHIISNNMNMDNFLSVIGNVTSFKDGTVEVKWANCSSSMVSPHEIFPIDKYEVSAIAVPSGDNVEELRQDQIETSKPDNIQKGKGMPNFDAAGKNFRRDTTCFLSRAAIEFFSNVFTTLFGSVRSTILSGTFTALQSFEGGDNIDILPEKEVLQTCSQSTGRSQIAKLKSFGETSLNIEEIHENEASKLSTSSENDDLFTQFDMASDCPDHHFLSSGNASMLSQARRGWLKKVQQEWSILKNNLPETVYVRVFEERMDLIRAVIIGAPGTPYHDGLFFFDIFLPPEYPQIPPLVHYISGGLRVNPNLYESGKVCLSLLNTWTGSGSEVWNPGSSTILQVLLSLQALVLNEKPYYNEAGYDAQLGRAEGERNSASYNENAYLVTCKSMMYLLSKPPKHFEALVEEHFRRRYQHILAACRAYMEGTPVGADYHSGAKKLVNPNQSSTGFKIMLAKIYPRLIKTFSSKGIDCSQFFEA
ncbi:probable ubiquitin-conjugating enzyme E2 24 [Cucurbita moschata]|uniref:E2 ubiquitin-conjugating enzyme n=1 Tax=Cucurbita moschata TaxID=3662 RepID=A0A6J1EJD0_CUCMO|nr:probable ubiquitin-conjugating enzyme E2 24 [Cucurbita moschata]XP_022925846.1 probable ubiquitin-conjugating enzyme E2 24 [Cucurbita moschata]XP_022925848.1 probable ubiquitin-conjugating enzyme E2 24 [Cucurbita moschata]